ncbi:MAG: DUF1161 domain-containing protein [Betaproteobacteria bacterium]|jgi:hypothetical protein|nr:DUF1161 domain-containing protein [Betaproteobacteria bacterium]HMW78301.1 DUF1161 domain-containing protein [Rhodocyclaceae bacterium]HNE44193.1 DUF1161 domain-containing protein [Rhodocyclaceae bacterium]HNM22185.1 DUF1161 domain-containing protein [Rhodocyclaceae bacterium]HNM82599.1 DUF1161 domain-containing protein [Rhodocyclaceae bacterium]
MKRLFALLALAGCALPALAAGLDCDELIDKISRRLESKHVTDYQLKAVPVEEKHPGKEVGRCERGSKKVMLERGKSEGKADAE